MRWLPLKFRLWQSPLPYLESVDLLEASVVIAIGVFLGICGLGFAEFAVRRASGWRGDSQTGQVNHKRQLLGLFLAILSSGVAFLLIWIRLKSTLVLIPAVAFAFALLVLAIVDFRILRLPTPILLMTASVLLPVIYLISLLRGRALYILYSLALSLVVYLSMGQVASMFPTSLGKGDVRLLAFVVAFLVAIDPRLVLAVIPLTSLFYLITPSRRLEIPFNKHMKPLGPPIGLASVLALSLVRYVL